MTFRKILVPFIDWALYKKIESGGEQVWHILKS